MAVSAVGPVMTGGFEEFVINDPAGEAYTISFLPDRNNDELQRSRQQPVFYYIPESVRIARKGDVGDFKFRHIHFVGVFDENTVGVDKGETQGGVIAFSTTSRFPTAVLKQAEEQILQKFSGKNDKYWGIRLNVAPAIRIAPIVSNTTAVSNVVPGPDGLVPGETAAGGGGTAATGGIPNPGAGAGTSPGGGAAPGTPDGGPRSRGVIMLGGNPWDTVPYGRDFRAGTMLKPWAWRLDGAGPGSITGGENAYAGIIGPLPSEILWAAFHGAYSTVAVTQNLVMPMWSQLMRIKITGNWRRIFDHFSAAANARYLWFSADIKAEFNSLRLNGDIKVEVDIDGTMPGGQDLEKAINQRIDLIVQQFTEQAKKVIFDPPMPNVEPAKAPSGGLFSSIFGGGGGLALKARHDQTAVDLRYEETRYFRYLQPHTISSNLEGFYNEIKKDPNAEKKYFMRLVLGSLGRKITRLVKPVVNWPDKAAGWAGEPVAFLSAQVGYPGEQGQIQWSAQTFQKSDPPDTTFKPVFVERRKDEVQNPPADWEPDKTYVKRKVHMLEAPGENEYPFMKVYVEQNVLDLDSGTNGTLTNDNILEVRADEMGTFELGPIALAAELQSASEVVEVEFRLKGRRADGVDRMTLSSRFRWSFADQENPRFLKVYTGQSNFIPAYQYRVHVTVKGTIFSKGEAWSGPWVEGAGNGALMVDVPAPDSPGVVRRSLTSREIASDVMVRAADAPVGQPAPEPGVGAPGAPTPEPAPAPVGVGAPSAPTSVDGAPTSGGAVPGAPRDIDSHVSPPPPPPSVPRTAKDSTVAGYSTDPMARPAAPESPPKSTRGRQRMTPPASTADPGEWVEAPPASSETSPPSSTPGRRQRPQEEDAGSWVEVPADSNGN